MKKIIIGITGASGSVYAARLISALLKTETEVHLVISDLGLKVMAHELGTGYPVKEKTPASPSPQSSPRREEEKKGSLQKAAENSLIEALFAEMENEPGNTGRLRRHDCHDLFAEIASGSFPTDAMVIIPCSMKTLSGVANGYTTNLLERSADVCLKERRPLILVTRESPLSHVHLTNMLKAHEAGAVIMPASPGFYHLPQTYDDLVNFMVSRVMDQLKIEHKNPVRWGSER